MGNEHINITPWNQQYDFNTSESSITSWIADSSLFLNNGTNAIIKDYLYTITWDGFVYRAPIINGDIGSSVAISGDNLSSFGALNYSNAFITTSRLYVITSNNATYSNTGKLFYAPINSDGTIGAWVLQNSEIYTLLTSRGRSYLGYTALVATVGRVYLIGGVSDSSNYYGDVYYAPISTDGIVGTWAYSGQLIDATGNLQLAKIGSKIYALGGTTKVSGTTTVKDTIQVATFDTSGVLGSWSTYSTDLPYTPCIVYGDGFVTNDKVYSPLDDNTKKDLKYSSIDSSGDFTTWSDAAEPSGTGWMLKWFATKTRVYAFDGYNQVYYADYLGGYDDYSDYLVNVPTGDGDINQTLSTLSGIAETTPLVGWGEINAPTTNGRVFGIASNPILADIDITAPSVYLTCATQNLSYGEIEQSINSLSAIGSTLLYGWGHVNAKDLKITSSAANSIKAIGDVKPNQINIKSISADYCSIILSSSTLFGEASTVNYGNCDIAFRHININALGNVSLNGAGDIKIRHNVLRGTSFQSNLCFVDLVQKAISIDGDGVFVNNCDGSIGVLPELVGVCTIPESYDVIQYLRSCQ